MAVAGAIGLTASVLTLIELTGSVEGRLEGLICEGRTALGTRLPLLVQHAKSIHEILHRFSEMPKPLFDGIMSRLIDVIGCLVSIQNHTRNAPPGFDYSKMLDDVEKKLKTLQSEYLLGALADIMQRFTTIANENLFLPNCTTGLDRVDVVLDFLQQNREGLRIVGIYGQGGLGKTVLLNKLWEEVSTKSLFTAKAYVVVGDEPNPNICKLQSEIVKQLFGVGHKDFPSHNFGKGELKKNMENRRSDRSERAIFLALDNVWDPCHLKDLLPDGLASLLPPSSCIVLTSRQFDVIETLVQLCPFQITDRSHVLPYLPHYLSPQESQQLFVHNAGPHIEEHPNLLNAIVPLCGGLPSALEALSSLFRSEARREESAWKELSEKMQLQEASFPKECESVFKALQVSYNRLKPSCQEAFLDVVGFFYGWEWHTVERILGKDEVSALKDHSLLSATDKVNECTRSEIENLGCPNELMSQASSNKHPWPSKVVTMHDLILKFGKCLLAKKEYHCHRMAHNCYELSKVRDYLKRTRFLWQRSRENKMIQPEDLKGMNNLRFLYLNPIPIQESLERLIWSVGEEQPFSLFDEGCRMLRFMSIEGPTSVELLRETLMSAQLRQLHLIKCPDIEELPSSSTLHLEKLECLHIYDCCRLQRLPDSCGTWKALQELSVSNCEALNELPEALHTLPNLKTLVIQKCSALTQLPEAPGTLPNLKTLVIQECSGLRSLPPLSNLKKLSFLQVYNCCSVTCLPDLPKALEILDISNCSSLSTLPEEIGKLTALEELRMIACKNLQQIPKTISELQALKALDISNCSSLSALPEEIGKLAALEELKMSACTNLQPMPKSIFELQALKVLDIRNCPTLLAPEDIGKLTFLEQLKMGACTNL